MSDISKKVFSIEPGPDEDTDTSIPEIENDALSADKIETAVLRLRPKKDKKKSGFRPIIELVKPDDTSIEEPEENALQADGSNIDDTLTRDKDGSSEPIADTVTFITDDTSPEDVKAAIKAHHDHLDDAIPLSPARVAAAPAVTSVETSSPSNWMGLVLGGLTGLSAATIILALAGSDAATTPLGLTAMILGVIVPMTAIVALWATLRSQARLRVETQRLANLADRLTRTDKAVAFDVETLASAIRRELSTVDNRLAQTRNEVETLSALIARQSAETDGVARRMTDRTEAISQITGAQRVAFSELTDNIDAQLRSLSEHVNTHSQSLSNASEATFQSIVEATRSLDNILANTSERTQQIKTEAESASDTLLTAESKLSALTERMKTQVEDLEKTFESRAEQVDALASRISNDKLSSEDALTRQAELLKAVDAQIDMADARLVSLLDHAKTVQDQMTTSLSNIDESLSKTDRHARQYTADLTSQVETSLGQTRRELSIMESEIRRLKSRLDAVQSETETVAPLKAQPIKETLDPVSDVPKVEAVIGRDVQDDGDNVDEDQFALTEMDLTSFNDLIIPDIDAADDDESPVPTSGAHTTTSPNLYDKTTANNDVISRPGQVRAEAKVEKMRDKTALPSSVGFPDKNWRWRDMLGTLESKSDPLESAKGPSAPAPIVERPGPGVPLSPPKKTAPLIEGSVNMSTVSNAADVINRLCEVRLPPDTVVKDVVIQQAIAARRSGGEDAQSSTVFTHLNSPVIHLRGVLSADPDFHQRVERFRRDVNTSLQGIHDTGTLLQTLTTDRGRAYLLCAAALFAE